MVDVLLICFSVAVVMMVVVHLRPSVVIVVATMRRVGGVPVTRLILPVAHLDIRTRRAFVDFRVIRVAIIGIVWRHFIDKVSSVSGVVARIIISPTSTSLVSSIVAMIDVVIDHLLLRLFSVVDVLEIVEVWVLASSISLT